MKLLKSSVILLICFILMTFVQPAVSIHEETGPSLSALFGANNQLTSSDLSHNELHATGTCSVGTQEPAITIDKYVYLPNVPCYKKDNIIVELRVMNCDLTNHLEGLFILEPIPRGFIFNLTL
jgi:hypothetical protein